MTIPTSTAGLAFSIINGVIRLGVRIDRLVAEKTAGQADMAMPEGAITIATPSALLLKTLKELIATTSDSESGPLGNDRPKIKELIGMQNPPDDQLFLWVEKYKPESIKVEILDPDKYVRTELERLGLSKSMDKDEITRLALYIGPGQNVSGSKLAWRIAMVAVDVLAEFTVENQNRIVRDPQLRKVVTAVLVRFSSGELENDLATPRQFLQRALSSTLNGLLDTRQVWDGDNPWLDAFLSALSDARESAEVDDDYLIGLFQGRGYRTLVVELLEEGSEHLSKEDADAYRNILADVLKEAAVQAAQVDGFETFFREHWTDLTRAGLRSFGTHGPTILKASNPILRDALLAAVNSLAAPINRELFSSESLIVATEAAIAAVAAQPALLKNKPDWSGILFGSFAGLVADEGLRQTFTVEGLEGFARRTLVSILQNPELIIAEPGLPKIVVASILKNIAGELDGSSDLRIEALATTAVDGALTAIAANPMLLGTGYPDLLAEVAGVFASHLRQSSITGLEADDIIETLAGTIAARPELVGADGDPTLVKTFGLSLAGVITDKGVRKAFSPQGLRDLSVRLLDVVGDHPELLIDRPGLPQEILGTVLKKVATGIPQTGDLRLEALALTVVDGVLVQLAENRQLLDSDYAEVLGDLAISVAMKVRDGTIGQLQAEDLLVTLATTVAANPELFTNRHKDLVRQVMESVIAVAEADTKNLLTGEGLTQVLETAVTVLSARGLKLIGDGDAGALSDSLGQVVQAALVVAAAELGQRLNLASVPLAVSAVIEQWSRGDLSNPADDRAAFEKGFADIADWAQRSQELNPD